MKIPFLELLPTYEELKPEIDEAYARVMGSGWYLLGAELDAFEKEFAEFTGAKHCVAVGSGLDALVFTLRARGIGRGDEVIVPAQTFIATWLAVSECGAIPVPVDVDPGTGNLDPSLVSAAITPATKAIVPVHLFGQMADMVGILEIAAENDLFVLEDSAQAHGASRDGLRSGTSGHAAAFSFYPGKNLGAFSNGGAVTTDDGELADQLRLLRNYGSTKRYHHECLGGNSRLDELQCAFLRVKLRHLGDWTDRRQEIADFYFRELSDLDGIELLEVPGDSKPVWHLFPVQTSEREQLQQFLSAREIGTNIHYPIPPHLSEAYSGLGLQEGAFSHAESWASQSLSLPIGPHLSLEDASKICMSVKEFLKR